MADPEFTGRVTVPVLRDRKTSTVVSNESSEIMANTVDMNHIKHHYYQSHGTINSTGIVPLGPELGLEAAHGRESL